MPDPSARLARPLSIFWLPMLAAGLGLFVAAAVIAAKGGPATVVWASGASGQPVTLAGEPRESARSTTVRLFADTAPTGVTCTRDGKEVDVMSPFPSGSITIDERTWESTITTVKIAPGDKLTCVMEGAQEFVLVERAGQARLLKAALFGTAGLGGLALGGLGLALTRRRRQ